MSRLILVCLLPLSLNALAQDEPESSIYNPHSSGAPSMYYSPQGAKERRDQALLKEAYGIDKVRVLEAERVKARQDEVMYERRVYGNE